MVLRLVNTVPGDVSSPVRPGQLFHLVSSPRLRTCSWPLFKSILGFSNIQNHGQLPEDDTTSTLSWGGDDFPHQRIVPLWQEQSRNLSHLGASPRRRPTLSSRKGSIGSSSPPFSRALRFWATSSFERSRFDDLQPWIGAHSPTWLECTSVLSMEPSIQALLFLRDNGSGGSTRIWGPSSIIQYSGQDRLRLRKIWIQSRAETKGWMSPDNSVLELFIRFNTFRKSIPSRALDSEFNPVRCLCFKGSILGRSRPVPVDPVHERQRDF